MLKDWMTQPSSKLFATKCIWIQLLHFQNHDFFKSLPDTAAAAIWSDPKKKIIGQYNNSL